jgi:hypothetical protein
MNSSFVAPLLRHPVQKLMDAVYRAEMRANGSILIKTYSMSWQRQKRYTEY